MCEWVNVAYSKKRLECSLSVEKLGINNSPFTIHVREQHQWSLWQRGPLGFAFI